MSVQTKRMKSDREISRRWLERCAMAGVVTLACAMPTMAQDAAAPEKPAGLLPVPNYSGDFWERSTLTGDWGGTRNDLANKGVQLETNFTQYVQGVTSGGKDNATKYGGSLDYLINLDLMRMGVLPGALLTIRAETRYGEAANDISGALLPVNTEGFFPLNGGLDEGIPLTVTTLRYTQFLCEQFGVLVGKFDTLETGNEFLGGRGVSQFMNGRFVFPPAGGLTVPYSTLGTGIIVMPIKNLTLTSVIMNTNDSSTTSGFGDIGDGWTWLSTAAYQYQLGSLPGGQSVAVAYAGDNEFKKIASGLVFQRGEGFSIPSDDHSWFVNYDAWQYIWVKDQSDQSIDLSNGTQDRQGVGLFVRLGFADESTNPFDFTAAAGIGAKGIIPGRDNDTMGIAYAYESIQETRFTGFAGLEGHSQAFEAYYNIEITPATHLTLDVQVVDPISSKIDTAVVLGGRLNLRF